MFNNKTDFSSCVIWINFYKSGHIFDLMLLCIQLHICMSAIMLSTGSFMFFCCAISSQLLFCLGSFSLSDLLYNQLLFFRCFPIGISMLFFSSIPLLLRFVFFISSPYSGTFLLLLISFLNSSSLSLLLFLYINSFWSTFQCSFPLLFFYLFILLSSNFLHQISFVLVLILGYLISFGSYK